MVRRNASWFIGAFALEREWVIRDRNLKVNRSVNGKKDQSDDMPPLYPHRRNFFVLGEIEMIDVHDRRRAAK
jgi:hypothetical protein